MEPTMTPSLATPAADTPRPAPRPARARAHATPRRRSRGRCGGLSIVEMLMALAITAMLLTATMVAIDASFRAYAAAAESASTQTATRLVLNRLLTLVRTSVAHGPLEPDAKSAWDPARPDTLQSSYLTLLDAKGRLVTVEYDQPNERLMATFTLPDGTSQTQPMLGGVTDAQFFIHRRLDASFVWVLERASIDLTVVPDQDTSLSMESADTQAVRVVASTMPRRLD